MSFFKNINATPRTGSVAIHSDGFSIYTNKGWKKFVYKDILSNARIVESVDGSHIDIDDIFGEHISDERVLYELILRSMCTQPFSQIAYSREDGQIYTRIVAMSTRKLILDHQETYIHGWFDCYDVIRDIFEKYPDNIEYYVRHAIKYLQKLESEGATYKYIDEGYMGIKFSSDDIYKKSYYSYYQEKIS